MNYNSKPNTQYATGSTCYDRKEFKESCKNDNQCVGPLQCDLDDRVCLKKNGLACANSAECVNNLGCQNDKLCGCGAQVYIYLFYLLINYYLFIFWKYLDFIGRTWCLHWNICVGLYL